MNGNLKKKLAWISLLYFAEGLPLGVVADLLPVYFRQHGVSLKAIGFMFFLTLPWAIKFLWSPLVDRFGERRAWISPCLAILAVSMLLLPLPDPSHPSTALWILLLLIPLASATQDIAIDAYSIGLISKGEEGIANGVRASFYRVALVVSGGATMFLVTPLGWRAVYILLALLFGLLALLLWKVPSVPVVHEPPREWARHLLKFLTRPGSLAVFLFILTYKLGDLVMGPMVKPFWVDRGMTPESIGAISTTGGVVMSICGALIGGWLTSRIGISRGLWILGLFQAVSNLGYAAVAHWNLAIPFLYGASLFESFSAGLGSAAFLSFLMRICDKDQAATQYALLSALFGVTRFFGGFSGIGVEQLGYAPFFLLTFFLALPCYILLPWVRGWIGETEYFLAPKDKKDQTCA